MKRGTKPIKVCIGDGSVSEHHVVRTCKLCRNTRQRKIRATQEGKIISKKYHERNKRERGAMLEAKKKVYYMVREGRLVHPTLCSCTDCGKPAEVYDHRDYAEPLKVEPVCRSCNHKRGPGKNRDIKPCAMCTISLCICKTHDTASDTKKGKDDVRDKIQDTTTE